MTIDDHELWQARVARQGLDACVRLAEAKIGVAGLGGLGSHIAISLARMGVGNMVLADFDVVDITNLHRQHYTLQQVGLLKVDATSDHLKAVHPTIHIDAYDEQINPSNAAEIFCGCDIVCEAFDDPQAKAMLVETLMTADPGVIVVAASGMAGCGSANTIQTHQAMRRLYLCGDGISDVDTEGHLYAARVAICANHQALMVLRLLLGMTTP